MVKARTKRDHSRRDQNLYKGFIKLYPSMKVRGNFFAQFGESHVVMRKGNFVELLQTDKKSPYQQQVFQVSASYLQAKTQTGKIVADNHIMYRGEKGDLEIFNHSANTDITFFDLSKPDSPFQKLKKSSPRILFIKNDTYFD
jgi:hypothetical protein